MVDLSIPPFIRRLLNKVPGFGRNNGAGGSPAAPRRIDMATGSLEVPGPTFPGSVDTGHPNRWRDKALSIAAFIIGILGAAVVALIACVIYLVPQQRFVPMMVTPVMSQQCGGSPGLLVKVETLNDNMSALTLASKSWLVEWVKYRHEIVRSEDEMKRRVGWLAERTDGPLLERTKQVTRPVMKEASQRKIVRLLDLTPSSLEMHEIQPGYWEINFRLNQSEDGEPRPDVQMVAHARIRAGNVKLTPQQAQQADPSLAFGFKVLTYDPVIVNAEKRG